MSDAIGPPRFKVGDRVIWTNDYGVCWGVRTISEVLEPDKWSNRYHITPTETPWMYTREKNLEPAPAGSELEPAPGGNPDFGSW